MSYIIDSITQSAAYQVLASVINSLTTATITSIADSILTTFGLAVPKGDDNHASLTTSRDVSAIKNSVVAEPTKSTWSSCFEIWALTR